MRAVPRRVALLATAALVGAAAVGCSSPSGPSGTATPSGRAPVTDAPVGPDYVAQATQIAGTLSDVDLVGQVLMPSIGLSETPESAAALLKKYHLGAAVLMGNVENTSASGTGEQVKALTDALRTAARSSPAGVYPLLATDQEYGWVTRIKSDVVQLPSAMAFGAAARPELTEPAWHGAGQELAAIGINVDFAPDSDVIGPPGNTVIGSRSYGSDAAAAAQQVAAAVRGLQSAGVAATLKHFPGHGHTTVNSHDALPVLSQNKASFENNDFPPFRAGIDAGAWLVMSGHLDAHAIDPGVPASFSHKLLVDVLRTSMGFKGVVVTDALDMKPAMKWAPGESAVRALLAGNDLLLMSPDLEQAQKGLLEALASGRLSRERMIEAVTRVIALKLHLADFQRPAISEDTATANRNAAAAVVQAAVTVLRGACGGPLVTGPVRVTSSNGRGTRAAWLTEALKGQGVEVVSDGGTVVHLVGVFDGPSDLDPEADVTIAMDTPYLLSSSMSAVRIATYSDTQVAMQAVAAVLAGKAPAPGRSPVAVNGLPRSTCTA